MKWTQHQQDLLLSSWFHNCTTLILSLHLSILLFSNVQFVFISRLAGLLLRFFWHCVKDRDIMHSNIYLLFVFWRSFIKERLEIEIGKFLQGPTLTRAHIYGEFLLVTGTLLSLWMHYHRSLTTILLGRHYYYPRLPKGKLRQRYYTTYPRSQSYQCKAGIQTYALPWGSPTPNFCVMI